MTTSLDETHPAPPSETLRSSPLIPSDQNDLPPSLQLLTDQTNFLPFKKVIVCFLGLAVCLVVSTLDSVIVATALPTISSAFNAGSIVSWVPSAYLLTSTCFLPLYGRFSDIFGRKIALTVAMVVFMMGNLLAGFSKTILQLIIFRGIGGAGGGGIGSMCQIVISDIVTLRERGKYQGIIGGFLSVGFAIGPIAGGALAQKISWRWCFWISVPISVAALSVIVLVLPLKPVSGDIKKKLLAIDFLGSVLALLGCALLVLPLIWGGVTFPWTSPIVLAPLCASVIVIVIFCLWEWKGARLPILPMYVFKHLTVTGVYITAFINGFIHFSILYYLPQYFQVALDYNPIRAGIFLIPFLVGSTTASWLSGVIVSKTGRYRTIIHSGFGLWSLTCGLISTITPKSHKVELVILMLMAGAGAGQTLLTPTVAAQASVDRRDMSVVTAFRNFVRLLGATLTLAVGSATINNSLRFTMNKLALPSALMNTIINNPSSLAFPSTLGIPPSTATIILENGYTKGFRTLFILNASLAAIATIVSIGMIKHKNLTRGDEEQLKCQGNELAATEKLSPISPIEGDIKRAVA